VKLDKPLAEVDLALEETGFNKAVRIREELIRWKTRLLAEQKELHRDEQETRKVLETITNRQYRVAGMLINVRNILRIPREKEANNGQS
jgi:hypothetical protein